MVKGFGRRARSAFYACRRSRVALQRDRHMAGFGTARAFYSVHFTRADAARTHARRDRTTGGWSCAGGRKRDVGKDAPFDLTNEIWRPAVSGTGGIQDDRAAGRQKPSDWHEEPRQSLGFFSLK